MQNMTKIVISILLITAFVATNLNFTSPEARSEKVNIKQKLSLFINGYEGEELEVPEGVFEIITPDEIIMRIYKKGKEKEINLAVVVSDDREDLHAPEVCYKLQGFQFQEEQREFISSGCEISRVLARREDKPYVFHFWYTDLEVVYKNRFEFIKNMVIDKLMNRHKNYALVIGFTRDENIEDLKKFSLEVNDQILRNQ